MNEYKQKMDEQKKSFLKATGRVISKKRKRRNITQEELGKAINVSGSTIGRYEKGKIEIPASVLPLISGICDFPMRDYLMEWERINIKTLVEEAIALKTNMPEEKEIQFIVDQCTPEEADRIKDIGLCMAYSIDKVYQAELLTFMLEYHIKHKEDADTRKRITAYYEKITGKNLI